MDNTYIIVGAVIVFGALIGIAAYLYRESALASGAGEMSVLGLFTIKLEGTAQKEPNKIEPPPQPKIEQAATELGRIARSGPEISGGQGEIKQTASSAGVIEDSAPKIK
jgi:hypothetical protein